MTIPEQKPSLVVVGSHSPGIAVRVKQIPAAGETVIGWDLTEPIDGGKGTNQAIAAARLGLPTSFVGCIGRDRLGAACEQLLSDEGVDIRYLYHSESEGTGAGIIILDENGVPAMVSTIGANGELGSQQVEEALEALTGAQVMLTQFEILPEIALFAARVARQRGMITVINPAPASSVGLSDLHVADVLVPNEIEARTLLGSDSDDQLELEMVAQELLSGTKAGKVIITAGEQGIVGADCQGVWKALPPDVNVVDTSGAGDVFCAALVAGLIDGIDPREASIWACNAAALSVTIDGTIPSFPSRQDIEDFRLISRSHAH
jgi:ribokinase